jgi:hypothetical protein
MDSDLTFKTRVDRFWEWYIGVAPRFFEVIDAGNCPSLAPEVGAKIDELLPGFAWAFGPGDGEGHSFTLTGEGNPHRQLLAIYWRERAPKLEGWTFHAARQPGKIEGIQMKMGDRVFDPVQFWLTPSVDVENETIDLTVWHPLFKDLAEPDQWSPLFVFLDEALGEYGVQQWIGEIKLNDERLADAMSLTELPQYVEKVAQEQGWEKLAPGDSVSLYKCDEPHEGFLRGDIIVGNSAVMRLINDYLEAEGDLEDPLAGTGAAYVFVAIDAGFLPDGQESDVRGAIEDALDAALKTSASGRLVGGAHGIKQAYIDLLLFDGRASLELVTKTLREQGLPGGTTIHFFARESRGQRVIL